MGCCKATKLRDINYDGDFKTDKYKVSNKRSKWVVFIILCLISPLFVPLIIYILYRGIIKNEALDLSGLIKLIKHNKFNDHEVVK